QPLALGRRRIRFVILGDDRRARAKRARDRAAALERFLRQLARPLSDYRTPDDGGVAFGGPQVDRRRRVAAPLHGDAARLLQELLAREYAQHRRIGLAEEREGAIQALDPELLQLPVGDVAVRAPQTAEAAGIVADGDGLPVDPADF